MNNILFIFALLSGMIIAQQEKFIIGAYAQSIPDQSYLLDPPLLDSAKINHIVFIAKKPTADAVGLYKENDDTALIPYTGSEVPNTSNLARLSQFQGVLTANNKATTKIVRPFQISSNTVISNFDWVHYLSSAYHTKFDATLNYMNSSPDSLIILWHNFGSLTTYENKSYWSSQGGASNPDSLMVVGPSYWMETRYRGSAVPGFGNDIVEYEVKFNLLLRYPYNSGEANPEVCQLFIYGKYLDELTDPATLKDTIFEMRKLRRSTFNEPDSLILLFNLGGFRESMGRADQSIKKVLQTVDFRVKVLDDTTDILIDYIECYDTRIWKKYFASQYGPTWRRDHIETYIGTFNSNSNFANKFKYILSVDEPHSIDSYDAIRKVKEDLDSLRVSNTNIPRLHTHFYPGWNGIRERNKYYTIENWIKKAKPDPFVFYYIFQTDDTPPVAMDVMRNLMHQASLYNANNPFHFVINVWNEPDWEWRHPRPWELRGGVMLALAHGSRGIFYEPFYSYYTVEGLTRPNVFPPEFNDLGLFVIDSLNRRLDGKLGTRLNSMNFTGKYFVTFYQPARSDIEFHPDYFSSWSRDFVAMDSITENQSFRVHTSIFKSIDTLRHGVFLVNLDSLAISPIVHISKPGNLGSYENIALYDIEDSLVIDFTASYDLDVFLTGGNGRLYLVEPVIRFGGDLAYDENLDVTDTLKEKPLYIKSGKTLTINANYTASQDIIVETGGKLVINPGKTLTFTDGANLRVYGTFISKGTSNSQININFSSGTESQNGIYLDSLSTDTLHYTNISNGYFGIHIYHCNPYIYECNISGGEVGIYADHTEYDWEADTGSQIINSTISGAASYALDLYEASPVVQGSHLISSYIGAHIHSNSSPLFTKYNSDGINEIYGDSIGIEALNSGPVLGMGSYGNFYGLNSITGSPGDNIEYDIILTNCGLVMAEDCWWGEADGVKNSFLLDSSDIDFEPYLTEDPFLQNLRITRSNSVSARMINEIEETDNPEFTLSQRYRTALSYYLSGRKTEASLICRNLLTEAPDSVVAYSAINLLVNSHKTENTGIDTLKQFLRSFNAANRQKDIYSYAKLILTDYSNPDDYPGEIDNIINWYPESGMKPLLLFKKFKYYLDVENKPDSAKAVKNTLLREYPAHSLTREAKILLGETGLQKGTTQILKETVITPILENYPNPFNPSTTIRYGINTVGIVKIGIYNILGELVQTLVNEEKEKGIYSVMLNAGRLSSGVYICRMVSEDGTLVRKIVLLR